MLKSAMLLAVTLSAGFMAYSQTTDCSAGSIILTVAGPFGKSGESPILSLAPTDLRIEAAGRDASVVSIARPSDALRVVIVLDIGGSQTRWSWNETLQIARGMPRQFPEGTRFSLVAFDDKVQQVVTVKTGSEVFDKPLAALSLSKAKESETVLYDALEAASRMLDSPRPGDAIFLITAFEGGRQSKWETAAIQLLSANNVRLFGLSFDQTGLPGRPPTGFFVTLESFSAISVVSAASSGVWFRGSGNVSAPDSLIQGIANSISDVYVVTLKLARPMTKPERLTVELAKSSRAHVREKFSPNDVKLSYPRMLYPCH